MVHSHGRLWRASAAIAYHRPVHQRRVTAGSKSNATGARPAPACRSMRSGDRAIRRCGRCESSLKCRSCRKGRYAPPVHMIKLTAEREITPYRWVYPSEER